MTTQSLDNTSNILVGSAAEIQQQEANLRDSDADLRAEASNHTHQQPRTDKCPFSGAATTATSTPVPFVPLKMGGAGRTHVVSQGSQNLIDQVGLDGLQKMTDCFYQKAFQDATLDQFINSHSDPHGSRFSKWIHQKLSGSAVWDKERRTRSRKPKLVGGGLHEHVVHDRSSAHVAAWYSSKRPEQDQGRHFKLDECRVWMRLHFWAMRETGLTETAPAFADYYVRFIGHFMNVYEGTAPMFARESARWSSNPANTQKYVADGRRMNDVLGLSFKQALKQLPKSESADMEWPYNRAPQDPNAEPEGF